MFEHDKKVLVTGGSGFIGTNLIDLLLAHGYAICNFDKAPPHKEGHAQFWHEGNLLNVSDIEKVLAMFQPAVVIHLAARTDTLSDKLEDYIENTQGTENLIRCLEREDALSKVIITSTQYVYKSEKQALPAHDTDYVPYTAYGQSKVITEQLTRESSLKCCWTIVRPANIWGPWHMRYPIELWKIIDRGWYVHPSRRPVIRTYGYVGNVIHQILQIVQADVSRVSGGTFYLGDSPIDSYTWLNAISKCLTGKSVKRIPSYLFILPALAGDVLRKLGLPSPLYSARFRNMIEDYPAPTQVTEAEFGIAHPDLVENVEETIRWINAEGRDWFIYWKDKEK